MCATTDSIPQFLRCSLTITPSHLDLVTDLLYAEFGLSVQLHEAPVAESAVLFIYLPEPTATERLSQISARIREVTGASPKINPEGLIAAVDWERNYRDSVRPIRIGDIVIRPTWIDSESLKGVIEIVIDPKMAFGTGSHETTRLCISALQKHVKPGMTVADIGCGSGILAIVAAKYGAKRVVAVDNDQIAVDNTGENSGLNDVGDVVSAIGGSTEEALSELGARSCDIVVANIILSVLMKLLPDLASMLKPGGVLILSGLLQGDRNEMLSTLRNHGFSTCAVESDGEWISITCEKSAVE